MGIGDARSADVDTPCDLAFVDQQIVEREVAMGDDPVASWRRQRLDFRPNLLGGPGCDIWPRRGGPQASTQPRLAAGTMERL